jgi:hypothetical protein
MGFSCGRRCGPFAGERSRCAGTGDRYDRYTPLCQLASHLRVRSIGVSRITILDCISYHLLVYLRRIYNPNFS